MYKLRALGAAAAAGVGAVVLLKVLAGLAGPLLALLIGALFTAFKIGAVVAVGLLLYRMYRRRRDEMAA